jgi:hypothetical protein
MIKFCSGLIEDVKTNNETHNFNEQKPYTINIDIFKNKTTER